jgi:hypothetical protein
MGQVFRPYSRPWTWSYILGLAFDFVAGATDYFKHRDLMVFPEEGTDKSIYRRELLE